VRWDAMPDAGKDDKGLLACRLVEKFAENMWNKNVVGAWTLELEELDYGIAS